MCQMCDEYDAELRRMGIEPDPRPADHEPPRKPSIEEPGKPAEHAEAEDRGGRS